ncbi:MAG: hypothetical protein ABEJ97_07770 [Halobellus sp.]
MPSSTRAFLDRCRDPHPPRSVRCLFALALVVGAGTVAVGVAVTGLWLVVATDGAFGRLPAVTSMTSGAPVPAPFVPVWTYGGTMGIPVSLVDVTDGSRAVINRNLVELIEGPGARWLGALPVGLLIAAGGVSAWLLSSVRSLGGSFLAGAAVAVGYAPALVALALLFRVGLGDVPVTDAGYVRVGGTGFPPARVAGDSVGLPPWRTAARTFLAAITLGGLGGLCAHFGAVVRRIPFGSRSPDGG